MSPHLRVCPRPPPSPQGYRQQAVCCSKCSAMIGWKFSPLCPLPAAAKGGAASAKLPIAAATRPSAVTVDKEDVDPHVVVAEANKKGFAEAMRRRGPVRVQDYSSALEDEIFERLSGE